MQTNPAFEQNKNIKWFESPCNQSGRKGKGLWRKWFAEEPRLKFRVKDWTSKKRCKWWSWRWWRRWWWTAMCDDEQKEHAPLPGAVWLWDPLRTRAIPERLKGVFTTRRYTNLHLPLPLPSLFWHRIQNCGLHLLIYLQLASISLDTFSVSCSHTETTEISYSLLISQ